MVSYGDCCFGRNGSFTARSRCDEELKYSNANDFIPSFCPQGLENHSFGDSHLKCCLPSKWNCHYRLSFGRTITVRRLFCSFVTSRRSQSDLLSKQRCPCRRSLDPQSKYHNPIPGRLPVQANHSSSRPRKRSRASASNSPYSSQSTGSISWRKYSKDAKTSTSDLPRLFNSGGRYF
jgi:hypothetical protein